MEATEENGKTDFRRRTNIYEKYWFRRSTLERRLILIAIFLAVIFIIFALVYTLIMRKSEICTNSSCLESSIDLLNRMDTNVSPCRDFYKFSCGNFLKNSNFIHGRTRTASDMMLEEIQSKIKNMLEKPIKSEESRSFNLAKQFYGACMNESSIDADGLKWMKQILKRIGGWPILEGEKWKDEEFDWKRAVHRLRQMGINFAFFISLSVVRDTKDPSRYVLQLSDPYKDQNQLIGEDVKKQYLRFMEDVAVHFGSSLVNARIYQQDVLDFSLKLANISNQGKMLNMSQLNNPYVLSELQYEFRTINWQEYINGILTPAVTVKYDEQIFVPDPYYLREWERLMLNTKKRTLANFIAWHILQHFINFMPTNLVNKAYEYMETINGENMRKPRWQMCTNIVKKRMGPVVSAAYVERYFDEETRRDVTEIVHKIKAEYRDAIEDFHWIDKPTRKMIKEKLLKSAADVISYDDMEDLIRKSEDFSEVKIYRDNILLSVMNLDQFLLNAMFRKLRQPERRNWLEDPDFVTGIKIVLPSSDDILVFPIGVLGGLYYDKDRPKYLNYGAVGSLIGQKIWQTFTETKYKELKGVDRRWWSPETLLNYENRLKCVSKIFGNAAVSTGNHYFNSSKISEEDLAYLIGVQISYKSYEKWIDENGKEALLPGMEFKPRQLFWIYFSGPFCAKYSSNHYQMNMDFLSSPNRMKINGIVRSIKEFSDDFDCDFENEMDSDDCSLIS